jgi:hypothetical protein
MGAASDALDPASAATSSPNGCSRQERLSAELEQRAQEVERQKLVKADCVTSAIDPARRGLVKRALLLTVAWPAARTSPRCRFARYRFPRR